MKLVYLANARLPTERAHGIQIMRMCGAFAEQGCAVTLLIPARRNPLADDPFAYYGVPRTFSIRTLPAVGGPGLGRAGFFLLSLSFSLSAFAYSLFVKADAWYSRDELPLLFVRGKRKAYEAHLPRWNAAIRNLVRKGGLIVAITNGLKDFYCEKGIPADSIVVEPDAVDAAAFEQGGSKSELRQRLGLPLERPIVLYSGHLYPWKGVDTLAEAAPLLPERVYVAFLGGTDADIERFRSAHPHAHLLGRVPHAEVPGYLQAADALVLPNIEHDEVSRLYTSPMKLFEYLASGVPMVASDLPSVREILDERTAILVAPGDAAALARGIEEALAGARTGIGERARALAGRYSWKGRATRILEAIDACGR